jgi:hypothetical protein
MSSTNRGSQRHPDDFYETPRWAIDALLLRLGPYRSVLEPAAGAGAIMSAVRTLYPALIRPDDDPEHLQPLQGMELDPERAKQCRENGLFVQQDDFLKTTKLPPGRFDLIVTNPPYSLAMKFVKQALWLAGRRGHVCMLLRLAWLASGKRAAFHKAYPSDVYVLSKRPSFTPDGKTDSSDYGWFHWYAESKGRWSIL